MSIEINQIDTIKNTDNLRYKNSRSYKERTDAQERNEQWSINRLNSTNNIGKARQVYLYSPFQHKAIQSALQQLKTLRAFKKHIIKWYLETLI